MRLRSTPVGYMNNNRGLNQTETAKYVERIIIDINIIIIIIIIFLFIIIIAIIIIKLT